MAAHTQLRRRARSAACAVTRLKALGVDDLQLLRFGGLLGPEGLVCVCGARITFFQALSGRRAQMVHCILFFFNFWGLLQVQGTQGCIAKVLRAAATEIFRMPINSKLRELGGQLPSS